MSTATPTGGTSAHSEGEASEFGSFSVLGTLGKGSFCTVFEVVQVSTGHKYALKSLPEEAWRSHREALAREANLLLSLSHPNIMSVVAFLQHRKLLMPLVHTTLEAELPGDRDTTALWTRRAALKRWPLARTLRLGLELARALNHCHASPFPGVRHARILHRDLRPSNVGLMGDGRLVLLDFNRATVWDIGPDDANGTERRCLTMRTGPLRYTAPEVALGAPYNHKCDVYSWAVLLWQMAAHETPYLHLSVFGELFFVQKVAEQRSRPKPNPHWPAELSALLSDAWSHAVNERPEFADIIPRLEALFERVLTGELSRAEYTASPSARLDSSRSLSAASSPPPTYSASLTMRRILGNRGLKSPPLSPSAKAVLQPSAKAVLPPLARTTSAVAAPPPSASPVHTERLGTPPTTRTRGGTPASQRGDRRPATAPAPPKQRTSRDRMPPSAGHERSHSTNEPRPAEPEARFRPHAPPDRAPERDRPPTEERPHADLSLSCPDSRQRPPLMPLAQPLPQSPEHGDELNRPLGAAQPLPRLPPLLPPLTRLLPSPAAC